MNVRTEYQFKAKVDAVMAMYLDPEYQRKKLVDAGHKDVEVLECGPDDDGNLRIVTKRTVAVDVPGALKRILKPTNTVTQTDVWESNKRGPRNGTWTVDIKGIPIHLSGTMHLATKGAGSVETIEGTLKASVPLVGGKLEKLAHSNFLEQTAQEQDFSTRWLAGDA